MKKLIAIAVLFALVAGAVFAADGININAWGRGAFAPIMVRGAPKLDGETEKDDAGDDKTSQLYTGVGNSWGGGDIRVDFRIVGESEFIGFGLNATAEQSRLSGNDDAAYIYAKPFGSDILKIKLGLFVEDTLRGKIGTANNTFDNFVLPKKVDFGNAALDEPEDHIFSRFRTFTYDNDWSTWNGGTTGFLLTSAPIDGLFIGLMVVGGNIGADQWPGWGTGSAMSAYDAWNNMQFGVGYVIPGIGHARAQWVGGFAGTYNESKLEDIAKQGGAFDADKPGRIELAFALTAVDGLLVDLGTKLWMPVDIDKSSKSSNGVGIRLGATYRMEAFSVVFAFDGAFASYNRRWEKDDSENGGQLNFRLNPAYAFDDLTVGLVFGFDTDTNGKDAEGKAVEDFKSTTQVGFGAYVQKGLGKGSIKAGLTYTTAPTTDGKANGSDLFSIPIILEYAFF